MQDLTPILARANEFFMGRSDVQAAARAIAQVLIELKLASGMTAPHRARDIADVIDLIRARSLPEDHCERLNPYVREKYLELWQLAQVVDDY